MKEKRSLKDKTDEIKNIISSLCKLGLNPTYKPIQILYTLMNKYKNNEERIEINIPFPEINKRIVGVLAIYKTEKVYVKLINELNN